MPGTHQFFASSSKRLAGAAVEAMVSMLLTSVEEAVVKPSCGEWTLWGTTTCLWRRQRAATSVRLWVAAWPLRKSHRDERSLDFVVVHLVPFTVYRYCLDATPARLALSLVICRRTSVAFIPLSSRRNLFPALVATTHGLLPWSCLDFRAGLALGRGRLVLGQVVFFERC